MSVEDLNMKLLVPVIALLLPLTGCGQVFQGGSTITGGTVAGNPLAPSPPPPTSQILFSPAAGTFSGPQTVTVSTSISGATLNCTTDGTPADPASPIVGTVGAGTGTLSVTSSMTINCTAVQGEIAEQNLQESQSGWKVVISSCTPETNCTAGTPTASAGGGVAGVPSTWDVVWGTSSGLTESMTGAAFTQILIPFTTSATNDNNTGIAQHKIFSTTTPSTISQNIEIDSESQDATHKINGSTINHNFGFQCEQASDTGSPGTWAVAGGNQTGADGFFTTGITKDCPVSTTAPTEISTQGHWIVGDTSGPAGLGFFHYDSMTINGTVFNLSTIQLCTTCGFPVGVLSNETSTFPSFFGSQDQMDVGPTAGTINRTDSLVNVTQFMFNATPVTGSAAYTIN
jgi:hypothetical protein